MNDQPRFSEREGRAFINVPEPIRLGVLDVACECGVQFGILRNVLWRELRNPPNGGTSTADLWEECRGLIRDSNGAGVFDVAEALYDVVAHDSVTRAQRFELELNRLFRSGRVAFAMTAGRLAASPNAAEGLGRVGATHVVASDPDSAVVSHGADETAATSRRHSLQMWKRLVEWLVETAGRPGARVVLSLFARLVRFILTMFRSVHV